MAPVFSGEYFQGDGRKDLKIQVESPELSNIGSESAWLPEFIVNTISDDIAKYSAITIVDTHNAKKVAAAQRRDESASFSEAETVEAGNFAVAKNVLLVSVIGKNTSYSVSVRINDKEKNVSIAAFSNPNCSYEDLESGKALKEAVADLLSQLNVSLTDEGKKSLLAVESVAGKTSITAQKLVAQGNIAQQKGSNIEALSYYIQAASSDDTLDRAIKVASESSKSIAAGDFGTQARNLIQRRNDFKNLIEKATESFQKNIPYYVVYEPQVEMGKVNYEKETFDIHVKVACVKDMQKEKIYRNILKAYENEPDSKNWGLRDAVYSIFPAVNYNLTLQLADKDGNTLGKTEQNIRMSNSLSNFYCGDKYSITVSANADTSDLILSIPKIVDCTQNQKREIALNTLIITDYMEQVFMKLIAFEEIIPGVTVITLPNYNADSDYNRFMTFFNYPKVKEFVPASMNLPKAYQRNDIMSNEPSEDKILYNATYYHQTNSGGWSFLDNCVYLNENNPGYPRIKENYIKYLGMYLPFEWVKIPDCHYLYAKKTDKLNYALGKLDYRINSSRFTYYKTYVDSSVSLLGMLVGEENPKNKTASVDAYRVSNNLIELLTRTSYPIIYQLNENNYDHTTDSGIKYGSSNSALRDFVAAISDDKEKYGDLIGIYCIKPEILLSEKLPKMQAFTDEFSISKNPISDDLKQTTHMAQFFYKLGYNYNELELQPMLLCNALNEILGYQPFLLDENGNYAHSMKSYVSVNYDTDGFMLPRDSDFEKCAPSLKKRIEKEKKKNPEKAYYLMKKVEKTE